MCEGPERDPKWPENGLRRGAGGIIDMSKCIVMHLSESGRKVIRPQVSRAPNGGRID